MDTDSRLDMISTETANIQGATETVVSCVTIIAIMLSVGVAVFGHGITGLVISIGTIIIGQSVLFAVSVTCSKIRKRIIELRHAA